jgi:MYXO-CTERM domain-containing protein
MDYAPPVPGARIISRQGCRTLARYRRDELRDVDRALCPQPVEGGVYRWHNGVDFAAPEGTPILSVGAGRIVHVYQLAGYYDPAVDVGSGGYGRTIVVELAAPGVLVVYAHCRATRADLGGLVELGEPVAEVGRTNGSAADPFSTMAAPHVHLEFARRWPLRSSDIDQRYDVLASLAVRGIVELRGRMVWAAPATTGLTATPAVDSTTATATGPAPTPRDGPDAGPILALGALFALGRRRRRRGRDGP